MSFAGLVQAASWHVDDDSCPAPGSGTPGDPFCSIQTAIATAQNGDEIVVEPGTYRPINLQGKPIWLRSALGSEVTRIQANAPGSVVTCTQGETLDTVIEGFEISDGVGTATLGCTGIGVP